MNASGCWASSSSVPARRHCGRVGHPRMVGRHVVGHVVEDQRRDPGARAARGRQPGRPARRSARPRRSRARSRASRSRPRPAGRGARPGCRRPAADSPGRSAGRRDCAARPPSATRRRPAERPARPTPRPGPRAVASGRPRSATEPLQPDRRVDLIHRRAGGQAHVHVPQSAEAAGLARLAVQGARRAGTAAPRCPSSRSGGWRRCRRRCRRGSTRGTAAGRASADRSGTSRSRRTRAGGRSRPR